MRGKLVVDNKGQHVMSSSMIAFILFVVVAIVILIVASRSAMLTRASGADAVCSVDVFSQSAQNEVKSLVKLGGTVFNYKLTCDAHAFYKQYDDMTKVSKTRIANEISNTVEMDEQIKYSQDSFDSEQDRVEYNMDRFYSDQLKDCYRKIEDRRAFPPQYELSSAELKGESGIWAESKRWFKTFIGIESAYAPPTYCIICSKVYNDAALTQNLGGRELMFDVSDYLLTHEDPLAPGKSLYEYIDAGRYTGETQIDYTQRYEYDVEDTQAVIYFRRYEDKYSMTELGIDIVFGIATGFGAGSVVRLGVKFAAKKVGSKIFQKIATSAMSRRLSFKNKLAAGVATQIGYGYVSERHEGEEGVYPTQLFSPFDTGEPVPDEFGVAIIPYYEIPFQCTFLANSYGDLS